MNPLMTGSIVRLAVRSGSSAKIVYGTVLAVGAALADAVGANSEPPLTIAYLDIGTDPRKVSGPAWSDAFKREVGVHHATAKAPVAGHVSIAWIDVLPPAGQELCGDCPSGPELPELNVFDYFPDLAPVTGAFQAPPAPLPVPVPVPAQTQPPSPEPVKAQVAVIQHIAGEQSADSVVHVQSTNGERVNRKLNELQPGNILPDMRLTVEAVTQAKDGKLYIATAPFGSGSDGKDWTETGDGTDYPKESVSKPQDGSAVAGAGESSQAAAGTTEDGKPSAADLDKHTEEEQAKTDTGSNGEAQTNV